MGAYVSFQGLFKGSRSRLYAGRWDEPNRETVDGSRGGGNATALHASGVLPDGRGGHPRPARPCRADQWRDHRDVAHRTPSPGLRRQPRRAPGSPSGRSRHRACSGPCRPRRRHRARAGPHGAPAPSGPLQGARGVGRGCAAHHRGRRHLTRLRSIDQVETLRRGRHPRILGGRLGRRDRRRLPGAWRRGLS